MAISEIWQPLCYWHTHPFLMDGGGPSNEQIKKDAASFAATKNSALAKPYEVLYAEGEHNAVLNFYNLAMHATQVGDFDIAKKALDLATLRIEAIYADDPNAEKAKSIWNEEKVKDFKGEPYERSMVYFYRGMYYLLDGDYQNARAMFLSAERQDTLSEKETFQGDFGMMLFLAGWASQCDGDKSRAKELFEQAKSAQPGVFDNIGASTNFLGIVEVGSGPKKISLGKYKELLTFSESKEEFQFSDVSISGARIADGGKPVEVGNVDFQATTRGGRPVQAILDGKASFKEGTGQLATIGKTGGLIAMSAGMGSNNRNLAQGGAIFSLLGSFAEIAAANMTPAADTRSLQGLPSRVFFVTGISDIPVTRNAKANVAPKLSQRTATVSGNSTTAAGSEPVATRVIPKLSLSVETTANGKSTATKLDTVSASSKGLCSVAWVRPSAPPLPSKVSIEEENRVERNADFRKGLLLDFPDANAADAGNVTPAAQTRQPD